MGVQVLGDLFSIIPMPEKGMDDVMPFLIRVRNDTLAEVICLKFRCKSDVYLPLGDGYRKSTPP